MIHFSSSIWRRLFQPLPFVLCSWILTKWALSFPYPRAAFPWVHGRVPRNFCPAVLSVGSAQPCVYLSNYRIIDALIINTQRHYWVYIPNEQWYYHRLIITFLKTLLREQSSMEREVPRLWNVSLELHSSSRLSFSPSKQFKYFLICSSALFNIILMSAWSSSRWPCPWRGWNEMILSNPNHSGIDWWFWEGISATECRLSWWSWQSAGRCKKLFPWKICWSHSQKTLMDSCCAAPKGFCAVWLQPTPKDLGRNPSGVILWP